jgi:hypothetical protein
LLEKSPSFRIFQPHATRFESNSLNPAFNFFVTIASGDLAREELTQYTLSTVLGLRNQRYIAKFRPLFRPFCQMI